MPEHSLLERRFPERRAALKREILEHALACFNEMGVEATTIDAIKARGNTSVGAIYHHFGKKEGILSALFFIAQDDQREQLTASLDEAQDLQSAVYAMVTGYLDWVTAHPDWARFLFQARSAVAKGPHQQELKERNLENQRALKAKILSLKSRPGEIVQPFELLPSLVIGPAENYCRAWLSGRVQTSPREYREQFAEAAWRSIQR